LVAVSQFVPALQIGYLFTYFAPLAFVLIVTMSKEAMDDLKRRKRDKEANSQQYQVLDTVISSFRSIPSSELCVGDIVWINKNQRIPADLLLLRTHDKSGSCFIRTDQLDGETDWKLRLAVSTTQQLPTNEDVGNIAATIYAEAPCKDIHQFQGNFTVNSTQSIEAVSVDNVLWMNTVLASDPVVGCVVYTGCDTRAMMNTNTPTAKMGLLDMELNFLSKILFAVTLLISFAMVYFSGFQGLWGIYFIRFLILFSSIIPISLRVNLDMAKTFFASTMMKDMEIPDTIVRTSTIPEELGRIEYLLTDKTGTLTRNEMELKKIHVGTMSFAQDSFDEMKQLIVSGVSSHIKRSHGKARDIASRVRDVVFALALCHNVTPTSPSKNSPVSFQASSPDEIALVHWAQLMGICLTYRDIRVMKLTLPDQSILEYEILHIFPFTSESKRMGIIVRDLSNMEVVFYQKGADIIMSRLVQFNDWLDEECGNMSREGLRTLVIARKRLSAEALDRFQHDFNVSRTATSFRNEEIQRVVTEHLEHDLEILGLTGVEDKLQDDVRPTLETLRNAGIKVWMLTGDKVETATCIALSSKLVSRQQSIYTITKGIFKIYALWNTRPS
jgi:phospholipid-translocating ATPase